VIPKLPSPRDAWRQGVAMAVLIGVLPMLLVAALLLVSRVLEALGPWPYILLAAWLLRGVVRYVRAHWK
jgi:hypothetical protein